MGEHRPSSPHASLAGRSVLVTGHTGFKGAWLSLWLHTIGAHVTGLAQPAVTGGAFQAMRVDDLVAHHEGDIRDAAAVTRVMEQARPEVVFHLAAQPLVAVGYEDPVGTFATNVQGTLHVLDAVRAVGGVQAVVIVTSDKVYRQGLDRTLRETDPLGHHDPYSNSKACAELAVEAWRASYGGEGAPALVTARAGNVIGGGDAGRGRLLPDVLGQLARGEPALLRNPAGVRPWQHVLDVLEGYLLLSEHLLAHGQVLSALNIGPPEEGHWTVRQVVDTTIAHWGAGSWTTVGGGYPETTVLRLDASRATDVLGWRPQLTLDEALAWTVDWHRAMVEGQDVRRLGVEQLERYERRRSSRWADTSS